MKNKKNKIKLLIIEEHADVRKALAVRLNSSPTIEVVATAKNLEEGKKLEQELQSDVTLLGLQRPKQGIVRRFHADMIKFLQQSDSVVILTSIADVDECEMFSGIWRKVLSA